jgi:hypothetical protein
MRWLARTLVAVAGAAAAIAAIDRLYRRFLREWVLTWGVTPHRSGEGKAGMRVEILEPERTLSNRSEAGDWVWTFVLVPEDGSTRLISRNRIAMKGAAAGQRLGMLVMEPGSLVMERKMLLGIKERAERLAAGSLVDVGSGRRSMR